MGQKIHPYGLRLGIVTDWKSRWYSEKDYAFQVNQDADIRTYLTTELSRGAISRIDIERIGDKKVQIDIHTGRPGVVIGRAGSEAERMRRGLEKLTGLIVKFNVIEVQNAELDATLLARSVADQLEGRVSFRRAMKRTVATALKAGAEGVRVQASGRLGGADMGRREWYLEGRVPLHTLRADIDYGVATAHTTVGTIGIKVWVYKGDVSPSLLGRADKIAAEARLAAGGPSNRRRPAKSRAEAAAKRDSPTGPRKIIEAGGGKRLVEAGGGKRRPKHEDTPAVSAADVKEELDDASSPADDTTATDVTADVLSEQASTSGADKKTESQTETADTIQDSSEDSTTAAVAVDDASNVANPSDDSESSDSESSDGDGSSDGDATPEAVAEGETSEDPAADEAADSNEAADADGKGA